ncbi:MAG: 4Fe-4S binding protein [Bacteroidales bacterium]|nr:4Fe-4S binding protein [Bacteroidales bacterium]
MQRDIIKIDEERCNGCGLCVPNCHEGALQVIDGKVRLVSELMCDGLGACIGHCPEDAITIERREAEPYDEIAVIAEMVNKGANTVIAHLSHLKDHHEYGYLEEGTTWLELHRDRLSFKVEEVLDAVNGKTLHLQASPGAPDAHGGHGAHGTHHANGGHGGHGAHSHHGGSCPGSRERLITPAPVFDAATAVIPSQLTHWPVQMHLVNPNSPAYRGADLLLAADCVAFSMGSFHNSFLKGKALAIACPKLDHGTETYVDKLTSMIDTAKVNTITVMMMEVPCCGGLVQMVRAAMARASRKVPVKAVMVSIDGKILSDEWI